MVLQEFLSMLHYVTSSDERDFVDRLQSYFTSNLLIALSILVSFKQFGGKPIECLIPEHYSGQWEQYAESYCWSQDTYFVKPQTPVEIVSPAERMGPDHRISYYQWVPFWLLFHAACFRLPTIFWRMFSQYSGIKIMEIVKLATDPDNIKPEIKRTNLENAALSLQGALRFHAGLKERKFGHWIFLYLPIHSFYVSAVYILTKLAFVGNLVLQLLLMDMFLYPGKRFFGLHAILDLMSGVTWRESGLFPLVTFCDFQVKVVGNIQTHTIQCVLAINIFNEKIFVFLWFWYALLLVFAFSSLVYWFAAIALPYSNRSFVDRHVELSEIDDYEPEEQKKNVLAFTKYLSSDGMLVLRMVTLQAGVIFGTELVASLWRSFFAGDHKLRKCKSLPELLELQEDHNA